MKKRSAEAGILGFTYQFIQTATKILNSIDLDTFFTVEGIEDLDISTAKESELIQYKYHEQQKYVPSSIQKPIALMFKHYLENHSRLPGLKTKYTLFCYFGLKDNKLKESPNLISSVEELNEILDFKEASKILKETKWSKDTGVEREFLNLLSFVDANNFEEACSELIETLSKEFNISLIESKVRYFSNAVFHINKLAVNKNIELRKVTKRKFIELLSSDSLEGETAIIERIYGRTEYINVLKEQLKINNVKPNTMSHIFYLSLNLTSTPRLIINLAKTFVERGRPYDFKPITIVINAKAKEINLLKKEISELTVIENLDLIFNDGNEDYYFNHHYFNKSIIAQLGRNRRMEKVSYNYKLISLDNFILNEDKITFDSPFHIFTDNLKDYKRIRNYSRLNKIVGNNLNEIELMKLFGGR